MPTPVKVGGRNELYALKEARRYTDEATRKTARALDELRHMREQSGRPDYSRLVETLGLLAVDLSKSSRSLEEMWVIRATAGQAQDDSDLAQRFAQMEAQLVRISQMIGEAS